MAIGECDGVHASSLGTPSCRVASSEIGDLPLLKSSMASREMGVLSFGATGGVPGAHANASASEGTG